MEFSNPRIGSHVPPSLHHKSCGCPGATALGPEADADAAAAATASHVVDSLVSNYHQLFLSGAFRADRKLRVAYVIPHHKVTGGLKILCMHVDLLRKRGHHVVAVFRTENICPDQLPQVDTSEYQGGTGASVSINSAISRTSAPLKSNESKASGFVSGGAMPAWSETSADEHVILGPSQHLSEVYPLVESLDAVVCGMFQQVPELLLGSFSAPIIYFEQGHEWLFGDVALRTQSQHGYGALDRVFHMVMGLPCVMTCVSDQVLKVLQLQFGRGKALIVPNGIDTEAFRPAPELTRAEYEIDGMQESTGFADRDEMIKITDTRLDVHMLSIPSPDRVIGSQHKLLPGSKVCHLLLVGDPGLHLKGFDIALQVIQKSISILREEMNSRQGNSSSFQLLPLMVSWICQRMPPPEMMDKASVMGLDLSLSIYINPPQVVLPALYQQHQVLLFTSWYEAWGMPVLEAMSSGLAVVSTECGGISCFVHPGRDCLVSAPGDVSGLATHVASVLLDDELRSRLGKSARETALGHNLEKVADRLEALLYSTVAGSSQLFELRKHPMAFRAAHRACATAILAATPDLSIKLRSNE